MIQFDRIELIMAEEGSRAIRAGIRRAHVWVAYSEQNQVACDSLAASNMREKISLSMMNKDAPAQNDLGTVVDLAIEHHRALPEIAIVGYDDPDGADAIMSEYGYVRGPAGAALEYRKKP